jgi:hypothetical protein
MRKLPLPVAVPPGVVTVILPVEALAGTVATIWVGLFTVKEADAPLKATELTLTKFEPVMVTAVPGGPELGVKELMAGAVVGAEFTVTVASSKPLAPPLSVTVRRNT